MTGESAEHIRVQRKARFVKGIQFLTDDRGHKRAVVIDLRKHGELWEDIYDAIVADERRDEPRESLDSVRRRLQAGGKLPKDA